MTLHQILSYAGDTSLMTALSSKKRYTRIYASVEKDRWRVRFSFSDTYVRAVPEKITEYITVRENDLLLKNLLMAELAIRRHRTKEMNSTL